MSTTEFPSQEFPARKGAEEKVAELRRLKTEAMPVGDIQRIETQHTKGKLTARERLALLLDPDTFNELGMFPTEHDADVGLNARQLLGVGVVTGYGQIDGRLVYVYSQCTIKDGALSEAHAKKICTIIDLAMKNGAPIIGLIDSADMRLQEDVVTLGAYADIFLRSTQASGVVPQISAIMGPCVGTAAYLPALADFIFIVEQIGYMFATDPNILKAATKEDVTIEELGGANVHTSISGVAHFACPTELHCIRMIRDLISYIPSNNVEDPPLLIPLDSPLRAEELLNTIVPDRPDTPYDMKMVISSIVDEGEFFEVQKHFAANIIVGFARLNGRSVGIIAQQPRVLAGVLDIDSADKGARFIRFCDCFNIPIITLADIPGFLPGINQEHGGIIRHGAKLAYAYCEATVPKIAVITRKTYGGGYVMSNKQFRGDINYAWPTAEIAVMGAEGGVNILFKDEIDRAVDASKRHKELIAAYNDKFASPYIAASRGYLDEIIEPSRTRAKLITALEMLKNKRDTNPRKKHGNIPL